MAKGTITQQPIKDYVAAISVGVIEGEPRLDLCYAEDSNAEVDMNIVMTGSGKFIEVQGTAETEPFGSDHLHKMLGLANDGINELIAVQKETLGE